MRITVEFYGIPRSRAGASRAALDFDAAAVSVAEVLLRLAEIHPALGGECIALDPAAPARAAAGYVLNRDGLAFLTDPATPLADGDTLLFLSADVGG